MDAPLLAQDLLAFIDRSPTPFHAVATAAERLSARGFRRLDEREPWKLTAGDKVYVVRHDTSLAAFVLGQEKVVRTGFRLAAAHTDSPNLRLKPNPQYVKAGFHQLGVEVYGGALWHTWLDRDLSLAGRVMVAKGDGHEGHLVRIDRPLCRIPNLAIHLNRQVNSEGLKLNAQEHLAPIWGLEAQGSLDLRAFLADELGRGGAKLEPKDVLAFDLQLYDVQPSSVSGARGEFLHAPRLDNLASSHAAITALLSCDAPKATVGAVLYDHEEVGSTSAQGAASAFLRQVLERIALTHSDGGPDAPHRALQASWIVSSDMAHGVHPNYADRHEPRHQPLLGGGPVLKTNVSQSYATDVEGRALFERLCREVELSPQHFVVRSDLPCGSTIGPITAAELGVRTLDIGNPMLSMHSVRELAATADVEKLIRVLARFYAAT